MRIGVLGCAGRMGRAVIGEVLAAEGCTLAAAWTRAIIRRWVRTSARSRARAAGRARVTMRRP